MLFRSVDDQRTTRTRVDLGYDFHGDRGLNGSAGLYHDGIGTDWVTIGLEAGISYNF